MCQEQTKKPHKHAELIKAWADGYIIQSYSDQYETWTDCTPPLWHESCKYRIKPEEKSYGEVGLTGFCNDIQKFPSGLPDETKKNWNNSAEAVIREFCKRNKIIYSQCK